MLFTIAGIIGLIGLYMTILERSFLVVELYLKTPMPRFPAWWFRVVDTLIVLGYAALIGGMAWAL